MIESNLIHISVDTGTLEGKLTLPKETQGIVLFAHGSGSSRLSPRNQFVASILNQAGLGTLLFDLLTPQEESIDAFTAKFRFDIDLLTQRLIQVTEWLQRNPETKNLNLGYFGSSTGAAAAFLAAAERQRNVKAVVSRGGRPDLADKGLEGVKAPTLFIVGGQDDVVIRFNEAAFQQLRCEKELFIIPGATHLFEEAGALEAAARAATEWFEEYLIGQEKEEAC